MTAHAAFALVAAALMSSTPVAAADLDLWPTAARAKLEQVVEQAPAGSYAVFDADNTVWKNDLEEAFLPFLENRGELSPAALDAVLRPVPLLPGETLYGYYQRLCAIDDKVCYPWIAQVFAGRSLGDLKRDVDALMAAAGTPIPVSYSEQGHVVSGSVSAPAIYPAQRQLIAYLHAKGVHVYVVTAASEELALMVLSDPRYGLGIAPEDVIGVTMLLRDPANGSVTTARSQIASGKHPSPRQASMILTSTLWSPLTWYEGKVAGITAYIDPVRRPLLVAGDSRSDWSMLFYSGGVRVWVDRKPATTREFVTLRTARAAAERQAGLTPPLGADANWVTVTPAELGN